MSRKIKLILAAAAAAVVIFVGGPFAYINFVKEDAPKALSFSDLTTTSTAAAGGAPSLAASTTSRAGDSTSTTPGAPSTGVEGAWTLTGPSVVGYRVKEVLFGQSTEAVGRTQRVDGSLTIAGSKVTAASFNVDVASIASDESRRDSQFRGRIMDAATNPTASFELAAPIEFGSAPADEAEVSTTAAGRLTLKGVTNDVNFEVKARRNGATIEVNGTIAVAFADYGIANPSVAGISTEDTGVVEFLLVFSR